MSPRVKMALRVVRNAEVSMTFLHNDPMILQKGWLA